MSATKHVIRGLAIAAACASCSHAAFAGEDPVIWQQLPFGSLAGTSNTDCDKPVGSLADGFIGDGRDVVGVAWWGGIWSNAELNGFRIDFWTLEGGCPDQLLDSQTFEAFIEYEDEGDVSGNPVNRYEVTLAQPFNAAEVTSYALSITALTCDPNDPVPAHFFWQHGEGDGVRSCVFDYGSGGPWRPSHAFKELAFIIFAEMPTTPETTRSWGEIKSTFSSSDSDEHAR